jgi:hypothetical protein
MNSGLIYEIVELALSLAQSQGSAKVQQDATVADTLLQIVQKGAQAYSQETGAPLDVTLIKSESQL